MMNWILLVLAAIASLVMAMLVGGLLVPARVEISRSLDLATPPEDVWRLIHAVEQIPHWCPALPTLIVTDAAAPDRLALRLVGDSQEVVGDWKVLVEVHEGRTRLTVFESSVTSNPLLRFLRNFGGRTTRVDRLLRATATQLGEPGATPRDR